MSEILRKPITTYDFSKRGRGTFVTLASKIISTIQKLLCNQKTQTASVKIHVYKQIISRMVMPATYSDFKYLTLTHK